MKADFTHRISKNELDDSKETYIHALIEIVAVYHQDIITGSNDGDWDTDG